MLSKNFTSETEMSKALGELSLNFSKIGSRRIFWAIIAHVDKSYGKGQLDFNDDVWFTIPKKILKSSLEDIRLAVDEIQSVKNVVKWDEDDSGEYSFSSTVMIPKVLFLKGSSVLRVKVAKEFMPLFSDLSQGYGKIRLLGAMTLSSLYSQRLYEQFALRRPRKKQGQSENIWEEVTIEDILKLYDLKEDSFKQKGTLLRQLIHNPIKEINQKTDLHIEYSPMYGMTKPVLGYDFIIRDNELENELTAIRNLDTLMSQYIAAPPYQKHQYILNLCLTYGLKQSQQEKIEQSGIVQEAVIEAHVGIVNETIKIKTTPGQYLSGVIKNKWQEEIFKRNSQGHYLGQS